MIVTENFKVGERDFIRTYSNSGRYVVGGDPVGNYAEACDPAEFGRTYTEGDLIPDEERDLTELADKAEAYDILTGVSE